MLNEEQKSPTLYGFAGTVTLSALAGAIPIAIIASAENGYVAGYVVLPLLLLECVICVFLFIVAIVLIAKEKFAFGLYILLSVLLLPTFTFATAIVAKHFEIGAYKIEPMRPLIPIVANKILFNRDVTRDGVLGFLQNELNDPLDAIQSIGNGNPEDGREVVVFSFFENASEDAKEVARQKILTSPKVHKIVEDVDTRLPTTPSSTIDPGPGPYKVANMVASPIPQKY